MRRIHLLTLSLAAAVGLLLCNDAHAQQGNQRPYAGRYQPTRPTVSPYRGPLPNYHLYVRPILQQESINAQTGAAVQQLESSIRQTQTTPSGPTGISSGYRNFSHYYSGLR
jgi:hypothetical protein